jgi:hypothetical protein
LDSGGPVQVSEVGTEYEVRRIAGNFEKRGIIIVKVWERKRREEKAKIRKKEEEKRKKKKGQ